MGYVKTVELANMCCHDLAELRYELRERRLHAYAQSRHLIQSFFIELDCIPMSRKLFSRPQ